MFTKYKHMIQCVGLDFCIGFIEFMLKAKSLLDYTNLFSPCKCEKNDEIILKDFQ